MLKTEQYYELDDDVIDFFKKIEQEFVFAIDFNYTFQCNSKQKKLIQIKKIPDNYAVLLNSDILVTINENVFEKLDDEIRTILFEQEIDKIGVNPTNGKLENDYGRKQRAYTANRQTNRRFMREKTCCCKASH